MQTPRLRGRTLTVLRTLTESGPLREVVRTTSLKEHDVDRLFALPIDARDALDIDPRPRAVRPPHAWDDAGLEPPKRTRRAPRAADLRAAYHALETTPTAVMRALADRIARGDFHESVHSPYVVLDIDRALAAAEESTRRYAAGTPLGPVDGIPVSLKDHHDMKGLPTRGGSVLIDRAADRDGFLAHTLRAKGALLYGKTHATEWGLQPTGFNPNFLMPRNPYSRAHGAGGSSTGAGVAVALGDAPFAIGSDGGGSIRIPSSLVGVFGLKPSYVRIGRTGDVWSNSSVATNGPLGSSVQDLVELLEASCDRDPNDPGTWNDPNPDPIPSWHRALGRGVKGARIGVWRYGFEQAEAPIARACREALRVLEREGAVLVEMDVPLGEHALALGVLCLGVEGMGMLTDVMDRAPEKCGEDLRMTYAMLSLVSAREYMIARRTRGVLRQRVAQMFADVDLVVAPSTCMQAPTYPLEDDRVPILDSAATRALTRLNFLANLTGLPAGSVPVGTHAGLPIGMQFIGDAWDEASVIAAMAHCERLGVCSIPQPPGV
jgi:aspartyl-tRNA(Asn)/glutamyl-tRNA(Gln) amidotransferase subunit A